MPKFHIILALLLFPYCLWGQDRFLLHGKVVSSDSSISIPNVHIISKNTLRGTISYPDGSFQIWSTPNDSLLFSSIGFHSQIVSLNDSLQNKMMLLEVFMEKDTINMDEIVVKAFYDWPTFKYLFVNMKSIKPFQIESIQDELLMSLMEVRPAPLTIKGPVQALYDLFNDMARLQRRLERNRRLYNSQLLKEGRTNDTIPEAPDHLQNESQQSEAW